MAAIFCHSDGRSNFETASRLRKRKTPDWSSSRHHGQVPSPA
ncbi:CxxxxCH/CxxCH domain-containing protein [Methanoregula sp.]